MSEAELIAAESPSSKTGSKDGTDLLRMNLTKASKICDLSAQKLEVVSSDIFEMCKKTTVQSINLNKNFLKDLPKE